MRIRPEHVVALLLSVHVAGAQPPCSQPGAPRLVGMTAAAATNASGQKTRGFHQLSRTPVFEFASTVATGGKR
jgi:hypothetical protein